jgi:hypothetical protein
VRLYCSFTAAPNTHIHKRAREPFNATVNCNVAATAVLPTPAPDNTKRSTLRINEQARFR